MAKFWFPIYQPTSSIFPVSMFVGEQVSDHQSFCTQGDQPAAEVTRFTWKA